MLGNILQLAGFPVVCFPVLVSHEEMFDQLSPRRNDVVCISALPPFALMQARSASRRLRARFPEVAIIVGLWSGSDERSNVEERLEKAFSAEVVTTLAQAVEHVRGLVQRFRSSVEYRDAAWRRAQLRTEPRPTAATDRLVAYGAVRYDRRPATPEARRGQETRAERLAADLSDVNRDRGGTAQVVWPYLPGTEQELAQVLAQAGPRQVLARRGSQASVAQLAHDLPQARWS